MSDAPPPRRTVAETRRSWWPGWIWAVPLAAIIVAGWLGLRDLARGGETVSVTFDTASGVKKGDTKVTYRGVKVGEVSGVKLSPDGTHTEVKLKLDHDVKPYLRTGTRFWLIGAKVSLSDLSSIKEALSGPDIGMEPGGGAPTDHFAGLEQAPAIDKPTSGTAFVLTSDKLGSLQQGSTIYFSGQEVGKITSARLVAPHRFEFGAFVRAPYDRYVTTRTQFWNASAIQISGSGGGVKAQLVSPTALLSGGVEFDTAPDTAGASPATAGKRFALFEDKDKAKDAPIGTQVPYLVRFDGAVGGLKPGAEVELRGFRVGQVTGFKLGYDARTGALATPVTIELEPARLDIEGAAPVEGDWRPVVDAMLRRLIARGLRASLSQDPPVVGGREVKLDFVSNTPPAALIVRGGEVEIPATSSGDIASIERKADQAMTKVNAILAKANAIPIEQIGDNVKAITGRIKALIDKPQINDTINHVDSTVAQVDQTVHQVAPQVGPLVAKLHQIADEADTTVATANKLIGGDPESQNSDLPSALHELTDTARSIRALADELDRHPEALIKGKAKPKGGK